MTDAEAGQIILENRKFYKCGYCSGNGRVADRYVKARDLMEIGRAEYRTCPACNGKRKVVQHDYKEACEHLGMPVPVPTDTVPSDDESLEALAYALGLVKEKK